MVESALVFRIPGATWCIEFPPEMVMRLTEHAQQNSRTNESVGQLYTKDMTRDVFRVDEVTKLRAKRASRTGVQLDVAKANEEREKLFKQGLHCLGFWHSHPEKVPSPSPTDIAMAADHAKAGLGFFTAILFVIVGTADASSGVGVWVHDGAKMWQALPELR